MSKAGRGKNPVKGEKVKTNGSPGHMITRRIVGALDLPGEIILNLPIISLKGSEEMEIENYKGVIEYTEERIRINTACGTLKLEGKRLLLRKITAEGISITGGIHKIEFIL